MCTVARYVSPAAIAPKSDIDTVHGLCEESVSEVRVRVEYAHTSAATVPKEESVRVEYAHTFAGTDAIAAASEVEAVLVLVFTTVATEVDAD